MATATKKPAAKPKKKAPVKAQPVELTPINEGVTISVGDSHADVCIKGRFDLDGLIAVAKRVDQARAGLS